MTTPTEVEPSNEQRAILASWKRATSMSQGLGKLPGQNLSAAIAKAKEWDG